ncbi:hypothetical protein SAMN05428989_1444 [Pseudoxanthomonas sp. GM95]|uniref:hypothetical protein n=1 Tax=Pseudoxanthomonas sp. GM95 TaxID=1881043 RepID=UPI0008C58DA9|nr:hypothetical protein [Pseudoxanthomonas sp. GM95]SEL10550.1 hypothetical protein SAMN05428989_1444 [Pseudoxanthomonas sp. GM95]
MAVQVPELNVTIAADQEETRLAVGYIGDVLLCSGFGSQFQWHRLGLGERLVGWTPAQWAEAMLPAFDDGQVRKLLLQTIASGHQQLWEVAPVDAAIRYEFVRQEEYELARARMLAETDDRYWIALALMCLVRATQANARLSHESLQAKLGKLHWINLDKAFAQADGSAVARYVGTLPNLDGLGHGLGLNLPFVLSELLAQGRGSALVDRLLA